MQTKKKMIFSPKIVAKVRKKNLRQEEREVERERVYVYVEHVF